MAHRFSFTHRIQGVDLEQFRSQLKRREFHEELAAHLNGATLQIERFSQQGSEVVFKRLFAMQANLPAAIQKLVKGALTLSREDRWDTDALTCECAFALNAPISMALRLSLAPASDGFDMHHEFDVEVKIPLVGKALASTLEKDIRKQAADELLSLQTFTRDQVAG